MKKSLLVFTLSFLSIGSAQAELVPWIQECQVEMIALAKGTRTPLQQEAELILQNKGYILMPPASEENEGGLIVGLEAYKAFYSAGKESLTGQSDCIEEDYGDLGKRSTCHYELDFQALDPFGNAHSVFRITESIRQSLDVEGFYTRVRVQLSQLPQCLKLSP